MFREFCSRPSVANAETDQRGGQAYRLTAVESANRLSHTSASMEAGAVAVSYNRN